MPENLPEEKDCAGDLFLKVAEDVLPFNKIDPAYRPEEIVLPKETE